MNFYTDHQLDIMMVLSGISGFIFIFLLCMKIDDKRKKISFLNMSFFTTLLLISDRLSYIFRGDVSPGGCRITRISNFLVFASIILVQNGFNDYLISMKNKQKNHDISGIALNGCKILAVIGLILLVVSQFTGLYYTFDETNHYQRAPGFIICYLIPLLMTILQAFFIIKNHSSFRKSILMSVFAFVGLPVAAGIIQIYCYGVSLTSVSFAVSAVMLYISALFDQNSILTNAARNEMETAIEMKEKYNELLRQTVEALASAVDAKDTYTHGHSSRVSKYAREIAGKSGMTEKECEDVYLAGLLHDVGKIGIDDIIINKKGKLTDKEFSIVKQHPELGGNILSKIVISPSLSIGARYHHERYDGTGYPEMLKGDDIPRIARIIAVADAYDAMTSKRSYRDIIPQMYVREELVKGMGTQFDPEYARIMIQMLDNDKAYSMKEKRSENTFSAYRFYDFESYLTDVSAGIRISDHLLTVKLQYTPEKDDGRPTLLFYDSADARYYLEDNALSGEMDFIEFACIDMDGTVYPDYVRKSEHKSSDSEQIRTRSGQIYSAVITMVMQKDHFCVKIVSDERTDEIIFALYDASRFVYFAITGEYCHTEILEADISQNAVSDNFIPRIAEKLSYIERPEGDIPNIQIDGWMTERSSITKLENNMNIRFHTMSLPSARRVWHCPIIAMFTSDNGKINGPGYRELAFIRLDGEVWCSNPEVNNKTSVLRTEEFENWSIWKQKNKAGIYCSISVMRTGNTIVIQAENSGLVTSNSTIFPEDILNVYLYFSGDQCALTEITMNSERGDSSDKKDN